MNPNVAIISVSAKTGESLEVWFNWLQTQVTARVIRDEQPFALTDITR